jgi:hypothetical protein
VNQRAKSYAEVARLMNLVDGQKLPGLGTVIALTNDFREEILEKKGDRVKMLEKLRSKQTDVDRILADKAEKGMRLIQSERIPLGQPSPDTIQEVHQIVRGLHCKGHGWHMWGHASKDPANIVVGTSMRKYVKSWMTEWDLLRLYPGEECELEVSSWKPCYDEPQNVPEVQSPEPSHSAQLADVPEVPPRIPEEETELVAPTIKWPSESSITPTS